MKKEDLISLVQDIVKQTVSLRDKHTKEREALVHWCCIFCQSQEEYDDMIEVVSLFGSVLKDTPSGLVYKVDPIETVAGSLQIVKIRIPDLTRKERGDADFAAKDYQKLKDTYLSKPGFKLIERETFEMIELMDSSFNTRAYFSNPPVEVQYGLTRD